MLYDSSHGWQQDWEAACAYYWQHLKVVTVRTLSSRCWCVQTFQRNKRHPRIVAQKHSAKKYSSRGVWSKKYGMSTLLKHSLLNTRVLSIALSALELPHPRALKFSKSCRSRDIASDWYYVETAHSRMNVLVYTYVYVWDGHGQFHTCSHRYPNN